MSVPQPSTPLEGRCSAINNQTLYVLSPNALQALPLETNATWSTLPTGVSVTEPACVRVVPNGDESQAALYVIGGTSSNSTYLGLQRFFFGNETWETLSPPVNVMQGRTNHSVAYLNQSSSILSYAGSQPQDPTTLSSQTFVIDTQPPYNILSFTSYAFPRTQPLLTAYNSSHAIMAGGSSTTQLFTFSPDESWQPLATNLTQMLSAGTQGTIMDGSDGSRVLETYDLTQSPNDVTQVVLLKAGGVTAPTGETIGNVTDDEKIGVTVATPSRKRKRDLTLSNWPVYNSSGAPTATRTDYGLAQDSNGLTVMTGGNSNSPLVIFDQTGNDWVDTKNFFNVDSTQQQQPLQSSAASAAPASATASSKATTTPTSSSSSGKSQTLRTLGITLGVLFGIVALFIIILLYVRYRKAQQKKKNANYIDEKSGNRMSFADRGASFMKEAGGSMNNVSPPPAPPPPQMIYNEAPNKLSHSSFAIIANRFANKRNTALEPRRSTESTSRLVKDKQGNVIGISDPLELDSMGMNQMATGRESMPAAAAAIFAAAALDDEKEDRDKKRSSGWSRYFANPEPRNMSHIPSAYLDPYASRQYSSREVSRIPSSAAVPPLDIDFRRTLDGQRLSRVTSGSPSFNHSSEDLARLGSPTLAAEGQSATMHGTKDDYMRDTISSFDRSTRSSDFFNNVGSTAWTPMENEGQEGIDQRAPSSYYTGSVYDNRPSRGKSAGFFPGAGTNYRPKPGSRLGSTMTTTTRPPMPSTIEDRERERPLTVFPGPATNYRPEPGNVPASNAPPAWAAANSQAAQQKNTADSARPLTVFPGPATNYRPEPGNVAASNAPPAWVAAKSKPQQAVDDRNRPLTLFPGTGGAPPPQAQQPQARRMESTVEDAETPYSPPLQDARLSSDWPAPLDVGGEAGAAGGGNSSRVKENRPPITSDMSWLNLGLANRV